MTIGAVSDDKVAGSLGPVPSLQVESLEVGYGKACVLEVPMLRLFPGEVVALVGASGIGKTTLLKTIAGELLPLGGTYTVNESGRARTPDRNLVVRNIQGHPLLHWLTVRQNLELAAKVRNLTKIDVGDTLKEFSAAHLADRMPNTLSGGEKCRASLCNALVGRPRIVLLDEPFGGLDPATKESVARNVIGAARLRKSSVLIVSHDILDAVQHSDRVVMVGGLRPATIVGEVATSNPNALKIIRDHFGIAR